MPARILSIDRDFIVKHDTTLLDALKSIEIDPQSVLAIRNGEIITVDKMIHDGDEIKLVRVISGG